MTVPQPGDFAVVSAGGPAGRLVRLGQQLIGGGKYAEYQHAFIYTGLGSDDDTIQAEPKGTSWAPLTVHAKTLWSTGRIPLTLAQRHDIVDAAIGYLGVPYSFLDYLALALHHWHIPIPHLRAYIKATNHQICSQEVDNCYLAAGVHLFDDGRDPGDVTPADLARLLSGQP